MSKFSTVALTVAGFATVVVIGVASSAAASTLPAITESSTTFTSSTSSPPAETTSPPAETTSPPAETTSPPATPPADAITADIYVALGGVGDTDPMEFEATGVVVGDGPELTGADLIANQNDYCGDATVDISLDPTTITVTGGENFCNFQAAYVEVTLHGVDFASTTVLSDNLFQAGGPKDKGLGITGGGYKSRGLRLGAADANPVLDSYGVSGNTFSAFWSGQDWNDMSGAAVFSWVPVALAGSGAAAAPSFTG